MRKMKNSGVEWVGQIPEDWSSKRIGGIFVKRNEKNSPVKTTNILSLLKDKGVIPYTEKGDIGNKSKDDLESYQLAYKGDIVLNSMNVIIGSVNLSNYFGAISPVYYALYCNNKLDDISYFNYIFQTVEFQNELKGYGNGILEHRMRIQYVKLKQAVLPYPQHSIQHKVANYLDNKTNLIDKTLELTKEQIDKLKEYKQALITETVIKGLDKNIKMKDSGVEWIGEIPEHWTVRKLRFLGILQNGVSKGKEYFGEGYPFVNYGDVYSSITLPNNVKGLANSSIQDRNIYSVKAGDVFFTRTSETIEEIGFVSTCFETIRNAVFSGFLIRFRANSPLLNIKYSKYYFYSNIHRNFFVKEMNIVTRTSLSQSLLKNLIVILPSISEQEKISEYLDDKVEKIDKMLNEKQNLIEKLEEYKKSLIYECVTGKKEII